MGHPRSVVVLTEQQVPHRAFSPIRNDKSFKNDILIFSQGWVC